MSTFGSINFSDLVKGIIVAFGTVVVGGIGVILNTGVLPTLEQLSTLAVAGLSAAGAYLLKNLFTNSANKPFSTEPPTTK